MKLAKITDPCQPPGTQMNFWRRNCPVGWKRIGEKLDALMPEAVKGTTCVACEKE